MNEPILRIPGTWDHRDQGGGGRVGRLRKAVDLSAWNIGDRFIDGLIWLIRTTHVAFIRLAFILHGKKNWVLKGNQHPHSPYLYFHHTVIEGDFDCSLCPITSLDGAPIEVTGNFNFHNTYVRSLEGIHKKIRRIGGHIVIPDVVKSHILGVLNIRDLEEVTIKGYSYPESLVNTVTILNKYLNDIPNPKNRKIHECQIELIEAGLEVYAQL